MTLLARQGSVGFYAGIGYKDTNIAVFDGRGKYTQMQKVLTRAR